MAKITVVGLGAGELDQLPLGVYKLLKGERPLYLRTKEHPVIKQLEEEGLKYTSFDSFYEQYDNFHDVYVKIVEYLVKEAEKQDIVYAVPGHPMVAEKTVQLLLQEEKNGNVDIEFSGGQSFLDALFQAVEIDPVEGFQLLDGTSLDRNEIRLTQHIIITQVYDRFVASGVKLELMEVLPDTYDIYIVSNAGTSRETVKKVPLYMLDRDFTTDNLTSVYVPPIKQEELLYRQFDYFRKVVATLRGPEGCPWDREQTHESLKKFLIEETYELIEAIDEKDDEHIVEELGDVLLQVMLHSQIGEDEGFFSIDDVIEGITRKMIRRHPHVFGDEKAESAEEVLSNWDRIKQLEKGGKERSVLSQLKKGLPALIQAYELQKIAKKSGFDWEDKEGAIEKLKEELEEWLTEIEQSDHKRIQSEFGDLLFAMVNVARFLSIHPEEALIQANQKFMRRFQYVEDKVRESGKEFQDYTLAQLDEFWEEAKRSGL